MGADPPRRHRREHRQHARHAGLLAGVGVTGEATGERERDVTPPPEVAPSDRDGLGVPEPVETAIRELDLAPPQDTTLFERHAAIAAAWWAVFDGNAQERSDFAPVYEAHPARFGSLASWYDTFVSPYLRELPGVEHIGSTRNPWELTD